ncbi:hypothetical protein QQ008_14000 [Fulvivirgaceae bacterium BMA10]|uniref:Uncharacterized protein n=1 Tax=Splendidivirga corallicola TaxID=3051826 RepID=A0ABT8KP30_9BACT|nr:hypothetical protein [Fulvivirgaceae bacterium BMA10]
MSGIPQLYSSFISLILGVIFLSNVAFSQDTTNRAGAFVLLKEIDENNRVISLKSPRAIYSVDINSYVSVDFDPVQLAQNDDAIISSVESKRLRNQLKDLRDFLQKLNNELGSIVTEINTVREQLIESPTPELESQFRNALTGHANLLLQLINYLEQVFDDDTVTSALSVGDPYYNNLISLLGNHITTVEESLKQESQRLISNDSLMLRVWCIHQSINTEPQAIHLNNYDNLKAGSFNLVDKVTFSRTPEEDAHLRNSIAFHDDIKRLITDIGDKESELRSIFEDLWKNLKTDIRELRGLFGTDDIKQSLDDLSSSIAPLEATAGLNEVKANVEKLQDDLKGLFDLQGSYDELLKTLSEVQDPDPLVLFDLLQSEINTRKQQFENLKDKLKSLVSGNRLSTIQTDIQKLRNNTDSLEQTIPLGIVDQVRDFVDTKADAWLERFSNLDQILRKYESLYTYFGDFKSIGEKLNITQKLPEETSGVPEELIPKESYQVNLTEASSTAIDIPRTNRKEGDVFNLYVQVVRKNQPIERYDYSFRVQKYGWYNKWAGGLSFVFGQWQDKSVPATSTSWILHNRSRPGPDGSVKGSGILGNIIDLGFGINSVIIPNGDNVEFGLGGTLSFLKDIIQVGYGFNLQQESDRGYFFVGASLFDLLNKQ